MLQAAKAGCGERGGFCRTARQHAPYMYIFSPGVSIPLTFSNTYQKGVAKGRCKFLENSEENLKPHKCSYSELRRIPRFGDSALGTTKAKKKNNISRGCRTVGVLELHKDLLGFRV